MDIRKIHNLFGVFSYGWGVRTTYVTGGELMSLGFMTTWNHCNKKCDILHGGVIKTLITP
jgi:hypothetical protein